MIEIKTFFYYILVYTIIYIYLLYTSIYISEENTNLMFCRQLISCCISSDYYSN